ncbi:MAG TPA: S8 family serine peptidase [Candidatus Limnocylindrales bacterium]
MRRILASIAAAALLVVPSLAASATAVQPQTTELKADPAGRWIVVLRPGSNAAGDAQTHGRKLGFTADRTYGHALRGYAARLSGTQAGRLRHEADVAAVVPDERIQIEGQLIPTGVSRVGATRSAVATAGDGAGEVDADVAIVDTGVWRVPDLNVVGGYSCSNTTTTAWQDGNGHGTHVAGTVGAIDDGAGVVGVAPGVRIWSVKILDSGGSGLLSWYLCGLDWIAAQHDPADPSKPLFEVANMSVTKWGSDDQNCGLTNADPLHQAICRVVASGVTVVAAAANDSGPASLRVPASYNEVITVSALADTDGKPGGLGGNRCYSWGSYDKDDTFADFSNYGPDVDLIAPGKCIWSTVPSGYAYMSGTSMAAPHVTGAVALLKSDRPALSPSEVREALQYLGSTDWKTWTDPDPVHERLLDVSRLGPRGDFTVASATPGYVPAAGGTALVPVTVGRSETSFERVRLSAINLPGGATAGPASTYGFGAATTTVPVHVPAGAISGPTRITIVGDEHGIAHRTTATIDVDADNPIAKTPTRTITVHAMLGTSTVPAVVAWPAASDPTSGIAGYELQRQIDGGAWATIASTTLRSVAVNELGNHTYRYRVRARDGAGNWSAWVAGAPAWSAVVQETSPSISWTGPWQQYLYANASRGATRWSATSGARGILTFSGRGIAFVSPLGPTRGAAAIYIDGVYRTTVSLVRSTGLSRVIVYATTFSALGTHRIEVRVAGSRRVDVDAFVILR